MWVVEGKGCDGMIGGLGRTICVVCSSVGDGDDEIDEDGWGRGGGGGKWHFGTDQ